MVDGSGAASALLDGFHAAIVVSLIAARLGVTAVTFRHRKLALEPA